MATHSLAVRHAIAEFDNEPKDSVPHRIASYIDEHEAPEGLALLIQVIDEDAPFTPAVETALILLPSVIAEVTA